MTGTTATPVPQHSGARASREYAQRAALEHRQTVRRLIEGGTRRHADIARVLNEMAAPSPADRPWDAGSVGRLLKRLGIKREAVAQRDAEALRDHVEELWDLGVRTRPQFAIALTRRSLPCADGSAWTAGKVGTLLRRLAGDWMTESNPRLQRGDAVPLELARADEPYEVAVTGVVADLGEAIEVPAAPQVIKAADVIGAEAPAEPQGVGPRRRAIRV